MNKVFIFLAGAAIGSLATWKIVENKYKKIADEEINSVSEYYKEKFKKVADEEIDSVAKYYRDKDKNVQNKEVDDYEKVLDDLCYSNRETEDDIKEEDKDYVVPEPTSKNYVEPYTISPDEYGENDKPWTMKSLMYYSDGTLADDYDNIIEDPQGVIGDGLEHIGEYIDECVYVRNENEKCDYEILISEKTYNEMLGKEDS